MKPYISGQICWNQKSGTIGICRFLFFNFHIRTNECSFRVRKNSSNGLCCMKIFYLFFYLGTYTIFFMLVRTSLIIFLSLLLKDNTAHLGWNFCVCDFVWVFSLCVFNINFCLWICVIVTQRLKDCLLQRVSMVSSLLFISPFLVVLKELHWRYFWTTKRIRRF